MEIKSRSRRLRGSEGLRSLMSETKLSAGELVAPIFVRYGKGIVEPIASMPGINRYSADKVGDYVSALAEIGIKSVLLFGIPRHKDRLGTAAYSDEGIIPKAVSAIKDAVPSTVVMADVCLCEYTDHGHCGVIRGTGVDNDMTLPLLSKAAVAYARAGADVVAPSAMMDGQVAAIRGGLDAAGYKDTVIMGYSAKYASEFYGPFRSAAGSTPQFGNRKAYQMDPANAREAMKEIELDIKEGADIVMIKPALAYLDVISEARRRFNVPIAAYNVSGEYAMLKSAAANGWIDGDKAALEVLLSIKRAGADLIITYHAETIARQL